MGGLATDDVNMPISREHDGGLTTTRYIHKCPGFPYAGGCGEDFVAGVEGRGLRVDRDHIEVPKGDIIGHMYRDVKRIAALVGRHIADSGWVYLSGPMERRVADCQYVTIADRAGVDKAVCVVCRRAVSACPGLIGHVE